MRAGLASDYSGYGYVGASRAQTAEDLWLLGKLRRSDWLPVGEPRRRWQTTRGTSSSDDGSDGFDTEEEDMMRQMAEEEGSDESRSDEGYEWGGWTSASSDAEREYYEKMQEGWDSGEWESGGTSTSTTAWSTVEGRVAGWDSEKDDWESSESLSAAAQERLLARRRRSSLWPGNK